MPFIFSNKAISRLQLRASATDTELRIAWQDFENFNPIEAGVDDFMYVVLRDPVHREIVKIDLQNNYDTQADKFLKVVRGQAGTAAQAWPAGTLIFLCTVAEHYETLLQPDATRQIGFNPNGTLSPLYQGEKILQYTGCKVRWWQSFDAINPYWQLIAGEPCSGEEFLDPGWGFKVWMLGVQGDFELKDHVKDSQYTYTGNMHTNGYVLAGGWYAQGLHSYSIDGDGKLTHIDSLTGLGSVLDITSFGNFAIISAGGGLITVAVNGSGLLTLTDNYHTTSSITASWPTGLYVLSGHGSGVRVFSIDGSGLITSVNFISTGALVNDVCADYDFVYSVSGSLSSPLNGFRTYSLSGFGVLTQLDWDLQGGPTNYYKSVCKAGDYVYCGTKTALLTYQVDGAGQITYLHSYPLWGCDGLYFDGVFLITTCGGWLKCFAINPDGSLDEQDSVGSAKWRRVHGDGNFVYAAEQSSYDPYAGLYVYKIV
jgi:hypothetical protein